MLAIAYAAVVLLVVGELYIGKPVAVSGTPQ
jgi:hypothetical protein